MKQVSIIVFIVCATLSISGQAVKNAWNKGKSPEDKFKMLPKAKNFSVEEQFAVEFIKFEAREPNQVDRQLWKFEALDSKMKADLESTFSGITDSYEKLAVIRKKKLFSFTVYIPMEIEELEGLDSKPMATIERIFYLTRMMQRELYKSQNIQIGSYYNEILGLYVSLNQEDRELLRAAHYPEIWQQQIECYQHKQAEHTCTCGGTLKEFPPIPTCPMTKQLTFSVGKNTDTDEATDLLIALNNGDLNQVSKANQLKLNVWGNVSNNIIKQLIYLHLAALGETKLSDQMVISLTRLWEEQELHDGNKYLKSIGLNLLMLGQAEEYYHCILVPVPSVKPLETAKQKTKEVSTTYSTNQVPISSNIQAQYTAYELRDAIKGDLIRELTNRRELKNTCLNTEVLNDSTLEVVLTGCDSTKQIFPIGQYEIPPIADFFYYCSNVVAEELSRIMENIPIVYGITVTGTADAIPYADDEGGKNYALAMKRSGYVEKNLGDKASSAVWKKTRGLVDLPPGKRYVSLTFLLMKKQ